MNIYKNKTKIMVKADYDFEKQFNSRVSEISGAIDSYLNAEYFRQVLQAEKEKSSDTKASAVIIFSPKNKITKDEAALTGDIIKKEFNGKIVSACSEVEDEKNYKFYIYLSEISKQDSIMFILTTLERIENQVRKLFEYEVYNLNEMSSIQIQNEIV